MHSWRCPDSGAGATLHLVADQVASVILKEEEFMQRFKNILVVVDEKTENRVVVERAVILAQRNRARLTVVNTVRELPRQAPVPDVPEPLVDIDIVEEWPPDAAHT